jgi:hypothetical protein
MLNFALALAWHAMLKQGLLWQSQVKVCKIVKAKLMDCFNLH